MTGDLIWRGTGLQIVSRIHVLLHAGSTKSGKIVAAGVAELDFVSVPPNRRKPLNVRLYGIEELPKAKRFTLEWIVQSTHSQGE